MSKFELDVDMVETVAIEIYYGENHPGSIPGWNKELAEIYQPFMETEPIEEWHRELVRETARRVVRKAFPMYQKMHKTLADIDTALENLGK